MNTILLAATRAPFFHELLHPLRYWGYQFWSGIGSDIGELTLIGTALTAATMAYKHIECHQEGCHRIGKHPLGHLKLCSKHHPGVPDGGVSAEHVAETHERQLAK